MDNTAELVQAVVGVVVEASDRVVIAPPKVGQILGGVAFQAFEVLGEHPEITSTVIIGVQLCIHMNLLAFSSAGESIN